MNRHSELKSLCNLVRKNISSNNNDGILEEVYKAIGSFPHSPEPHNLLGIILEKDGNHVMAMRHFRVALDLDPTFQPAQHNLEIYGTFFSTGKCAFDVDDLPRR